MRALSVCIAASMLLASATASAQMNPSNEPVISGDGTELVGEIAIEANGLSSSDLKQLKLDYSLHSNSAWSDDNDEIEITDVDPSTEEEVLTKMRHDPRIKFAERQHIFHADSNWTPNDPMFDVQWNMKRVGAQKVWAYTAGSGVVSVIDTGVNEASQDFGGTKFVAGYNFVDDNDNTNGIHPHGGHCAGTISQTTNNSIGVVGLSYETAIMPIKGLGDQGQGTMSGIAESIRYATDHSVQIISMSLGTTQEDGLTRDAVAYAIAHHVLVVCAAGNSGDTRAHYPSNYPGVVSVGASDQNDHLARFSTRGHSSIAAPGVQITQAIPDGHGGEKFEAFQGSSMACPHVASAASLMVSLGLRGEAIKDAILSNADDKGDPVLFGAGILNAGKAVRSVYWHQFIWRTGLLFFFAMMLKRHVKKLGGVPVKPGTFAMLLAGTGLVPMLPLVSMLPKLGSLRLLGELAMRPFGMWDTVLIGANFHNWLLFASAIPAVILLLLGYGVKAFRSSIGGFCLGSTALLTQLFIQNDGDWGLFYRLFIAANAALAICIARVCLDGKMDANDAVVPGITN